ncbi:MAG: hypothetical protein D3904_00870 [Candidatus Electrothrix sp. EH2]|nr:hypothetical protein [Candidatus Electrothrix sp. EH2]
MAEEYKCGICNYQLEAGKRPEDLDEDWTCPVCHAKKETLVKVVAQPEVEVVLDPDLPENLSSGQLSALFGNLAKGSEKQGRTDEKKLFQALADYYKGRMTTSSGKGYNEIKSLLAENMDEDFHAAMTEAKTFGDRGALRALTWGERTSHMISSLLKNKAESLDKIRQGQSVYVCQICGYVVVHDEVLERCPVCGVPNHKIEAV